MRSRLAPILAFLLSLPAVLAYQVGDIPVFGLLEDFAENPLANVVLVKILYGMIVATFLRWLMHHTFLKDSKDSSGSNYAWVIAVCAGLLVAVFTPAELIGSLAGFLGGWIILIVYVGSILFTIGALGWAQERWGASISNGAVRIIIALILIVFGLNFLAWLQDLAMNEWFTNAGDRVAGLLPAIGQFAGYLLIVWIVLKTVEAARAAGPAMGRGMRSAGSWLGNNVPKGASRVRDAFRRDRQGEHDERKAENVEHEEEHETEEAVREEEQERQDIHHISNLFKLVAKVTESPQAWEQNQELRARVGQWMAKFEHVVEPLKRDAKRLRHTFQKLKRLDVEERDFLKRGNRAFTWVRKDLKKAGVDDEKAESHVKRVYDRHKNLLKRYRALSAALQHVNEQEDMIDREVRNALKEITDSYPRLWNDLEKTLEGEYTTQETSDRKKAADVQVWLSNVHNSALHYAQLFERVEHQLVNLEKATHELERYEQDEDTRLMRELRETKGSERDLKQTIRKYQQ